MFPEQHAVGAESASHPDSAAGPTCWAGQCTCLPGHPDATDNAGEPEAHDSDDDFVLKPMDVILGDGGCLSLAMANFLKEINSVGSKSITPEHLFRQVCKCSSQFSTYEQQDTHELLRCLLESIRVEELQRVKKARLNSFAINERTDPAKVPPRMRKIIQGCGRQATHTIVDQIFGGQLISTVIWEECQWSSQVFEPFMDLSLPVFKDKGKPRSVCGGDDRVLDRFGRALGERGCLSKHQLKKRKKLAKQKANGGKMMCVDRKAELQSRLSEKRRPGDEQLLAAECARAEQQLADCRVPLNGVPAIVPSIIVVGLQILPPTQRHLQYHRCRSHR